jgi:hypothetical protein
LNGSDHAACASRARTRVSSMTASVPQSWPEHRPRSRRRGAICHRLLLQY